MSPAFKLLFPYILLFICINLAIVAFWNVLSKYGVDNYVLLGANGLVMVLSILVFFLQKSALRKSNPNVFIRSIMSGMLIKMFSCVAAVLIYTVSSGSNFNKKAVFFSMLLYLVYLAVEVYTTTKLNKKENA